MLLYSVLQHCEFQLIDIPRFCYHDQLSLAGNCRLCLVESSTSIKPILSCATEVSADLEIFTTSLLVKQAREYMLEFLLINHPLDCPICDQGGECDLQDLTVVYGSDQSKYAEAKRGVKSFFFGPLVKVVMTRCIQCTRCVRFFDEIVGQTFLGTAGRGSSNSITPYVNIDISYLSSHNVGRQIFDFTSEITGNVIDVCPVGALTVKPSAYMLRIWEVVATETIDILDSVCSNIRIETSGSNILRILPRLNAIINNEWITDKIRFCALGLANARLFVPSIRDEPWAAYYTIAAGVDYSFDIKHINCSIINTDRYTHISWNKAYSFFVFGIMTHVANSIDNFMHSFFSYAGALLNTFSFFLFKYLCTVLGLSNINTHVCTDVDLRLAYLFSDNLSSIFNSCNVFFLLAVNIKKESPMLNVRIANRLVNKNTIMRVGYIGTNMFTKHKARHIGITSYSLFRFFSGAFSFCTNVYTNMQQAACVVGRAVSTALYNLVGCYSYFKACNVLQLHSGDIARSELCISAAYTARTFFSKIGMQLLGAYNAVGRLSFGLFVGIEEWEVEYSIRNNLINAFSVYVGHHVSTYSVISYALLLPSCSFNEEHGIYINCFGVAQRTISAVKNKHTYATSVIIYGLLRFVLRRVLLTYMSATIVYTVNYMLRIFHIYVPHLFNYINDFYVCKQLLHASKRFCIIRNLIYVLTVRSNFSTDVITRHNSLFFENGNIDSTESATFYTVKKVRINYEDYN
jgi:NADH dehydrogenase/NADH:ubiquinone oxidoreductase subunit G